jgi:hypothetical protein
MGPHGWYAHLVGRHNPNNRRLRSSPGRSRRSRSLATTWAAWRSTRGQAPRTARAPRRATTARGPWRPAPRRTRRTPPARAWRPDGVGWDRGQALPKPGKDVCLEREISPALGSYALRKPPAVHRPQGPWYGSRYARGQQDPRPGRLPLPAVSRRSSPVPLREAGSQMSRSCQPAFAAARTRRAHCGACRSLQERPPRQRDWACASLRRRRSTGSNPAAVPTNSLILSGVGAASRRSRRRLWSRRCPWSLIRAGAAGFGTRSGRCSRSRCALCWRVLLAPQAASDVLPTPEGVPQPPPATTTAMTATATSDRQQATRRIGCGHGGETSRPPVPQTPRTRDDLKDGDKVGIDRIRLVSKEPTEWW